MDILDKNKEQLLQLNEHQVILRERKRERENERENERDREREREKYRIERKCLRNTDTD